MTPRDRRIDDGLIFSLTDANSMNGDTDHDTSTSTNNGTHLHLLPLEKPLEYFLRVHDRFSMQYNIATIQHENLIASLWHFINMGLAPLVSD